MVAILTLGRGIWLLWFVLAPVVTAPLTGNDRTRFRTVVDSTCDDEIEASRLGKYFSSSVNLFSRLERGSMP